MLNLLPWQRKDALPVRTCCQQREFRDSSPEFGVREIEPVDLCLEKGYIVLELQVVFFGNVARLNGIDRRLLNAPVYAACSKVFLRL